MTTIHVFDPASCCSSDVCDSDADQELVGFSADVDWCIRLMKKSNSIVNTHLTLIKYLNEGVTTANRKTSLKERYNIMSKHYGSFSTFMHHVWFAVRAIVNPEKKN